MQNESQSRACREGWLGRRRTYRCRKCKDKFRVDTLKPLPLDKRICNKCSQEINVQV